MLQNQPLSLISIYKIKFARNCLPNNKSIIHWSAGMCIVQPSNSKTHLPLNKQLWSITQNEKDTVFLKNKGLSNLWRNKYRLCTGASTYICYSRQRGWQADRQKESCAFIWWKTSMTLPKLVCTVVWHSVMWQWTLQLNRKTNIFYSDYTTS